MAKKKKPTKEQVYDDQISPLMEQVIEICNANKIPIVADFYLGNDLACTTAIIPDDFDPSDRQREMYRIAYPHQRSPLMVTTRDGEGKVTSMTAIL